MRSHRGLGAFFVVAVVVAALTFAPGASAAGGGECQLKGTASFSPGLNTTSQPFTYSFSGDLTGCNSSEAGSPAAGRVQAGGTYVDLGHRQGVRDAQLDRHRQLRQQHDRGPGADHVGGRHAHADPVHDQQARPRPWRWRAA